MCMCIYIYACVYIYVSGSCNAYPHTDTQTYGCTFVSTSILSPCPRLCLSVSTTETQCFEPAASLDMLVPGSKGSNLHPSCISIRFDITLVTLFTAMQRHAMP